MRAELHALVRALSRADWVEAAASIRRGDCFCPLANAAYSSMLCDPESLVRVGWQWMKQQLTPKVAAS